MGTTNTTMRPPEVESVESTPKLNIDSEVTKLKNGFGELMNKIRTLEKRLYPFLSKSGVGIPECDRGDADGKLYNEMANMNQDLEWAIESIACLTDNLETRGEF